MQDEKKPEAEALRDRAADATSEDTLADLKEEQEMGSSGKEGDAPSPDAEPDAHAGKPDETGLI